MPPPLLLHLSSPRSLRDAFWAPSASGVDLARPLLFPPSSSSSAAAASGGGGRSLFSTSPPFPPLNPSSALRLRWARNICQSSGSSPSDLCGKKGLKGERTAEVLRSAAWGAAAVLHSVCSLLLVALSGVDGKPTRGPTRAATWSYQASSSCQVACRFQLSITLFKHDPLVKSEKNARWRAGGRKRVQRLYSKYICFPSRRGAKSRNLKLGAAE